MTALVTRRRALGLLGCLLAAPAIVRVGSLMPVRALEPAGEWIELELRGFSFEVGNLIRITDSLLRDAVYEIVATTPVKAGMRRLLVNPLLFDTRGLLPFVAAP